jgi:hypothetical protein
MHPDASHHAPLVERWLDATAGDLDAPRLNALLERTLLALWNGAHNTLGEVTLSAIVDRVLYVASEQFPFVAITRVEGHGASFAVRSLCDVQNERRLREVMSFVLAEFLGVLGNLTDGILTPALHTALASVTREEPEPVARDEDEGNVR